MKRKEKTIMNADTNNSNDPGSGIARPAPASRRTLSTPHLSPKYLGLAFGATGLVFYLGCVLTMATVPHEAAVMFFNSLLHGLDVEPVLKTSVPPSQVALGLATTFALGWFAGVLIAGIYNLCLRMGK
jgi:hypothetical protein